MLILLALFPRLFQRVLILDETDPRSLLDVASRPEAGECRHVVRVRRRQRKRLVLLGRAEAPALLLLEVQDLGRQNAPLLQRRRYLLRDSAEVLADHESVMPNALQREDAEQIVGRVPHVRSFPPCLPLGNPEEAEQSHHVVDAQRARMPKAALHETDEVAVAVASQRSRIDWR